MTRFLGVLMAGVLAQATLAQDTQVATEPASAEPAEEAAEAEEKKNVPKPGDEDYTPPPGFVTKKRGAYVMYCKRDRETGTRFTTEKCYDKVQMREYLLALEIQKRDVDRIRSTCATASVCAPQ